MLIKCKYKIHGFFVGNTYYIRFLDNEHNMYDSEGYGTVTTFPFPMNEYDVLSAKCEELQSFLTLEREKSDYNNDLICNYCSRCSIVDEKDNEKIANKLKL